MSASHEDYSGWVPALHQGINFYHDNLLDRWVVSGINRIVFLNHSSYEVLKRCDGKTDLSTICDELCDSGIFQQATVHDNVLNIIQDFDINGYICNLINNHA